MSILTPVQLARARVEKKRYLLSVLLMVCANALSLLIGPFHLRTLVQIVVGFAGVAMSVFSLVMTWRLCRAINIGIPMTILNTLLAPFVFITVLIVLLRIYAKRTGLAFTFLLGDKDPPQSVAA